MAKKKQSRTARIRERIAETTAVAKEKFIPIEDGPDPRMHRHEIPSLISVKEAAGGSFEESFDYEDPTSERFLPEGMDGVIQIKTRGEVAADDAYAMVLKDPASVLAPRQFYSEGGPKHRTIVDAGHELAKKQISEHHDPDRLDRVRAGLGVASDVQDSSAAEDFYCPESVSTLNSGDGVACGRLVAADGMRCTEHAVPAEVEEMLAREIQQQSPHAEALGCASCGEPTTAGATSISRSGKVYHSFCVKGVNLDD